ncbi:TFIIH C1-like domain containing protein [Parasponia andersonii]|uniref:TFIIH C1-like domain containing protein n=1 Tax=Parasponia andersonii TaxID=3476 RepID=A0A2P5CDS0_PARAD|nr:TFIIH C1-like domain containing protein [Parasponia andersonii]
MEKEEQVFINGGSSYLEVNDPLLTHVCTICGKGFSSGKALGGHKRFHIQTERRAAASTPDECINGHFKTMKAKNPNMKDAATNENLCCVCGKDFPSTKALSGHMRSHPEREWRGIQPPMMLASERISCSHDAQKPKSDDDDDAADDDDDDDDEGEADDDYDHDINKTMSTAAITAVDLSEIIPPSWSKTDRRGRTVNPAVAAADGLLNLSRSGDLWLLKKKKKLKVRAVSEKGTLLRFSTTTTTCGIDTCNSEEKHVLFNDQPCDVRAMKKKKIKYCSEEKKRKSASVSGSIESDQENVSNKKVSTSTTTTNLYKCSSCDKSFSTFQALGGHRSTHNKDNYKKSSTTSKKEFQVVETVYSKLTNICGEIEDKKFSNATTAEDSEMHHVRSHDVTLPTELADPSMTMTDDDQIASSSEVDLLGGNRCTTKATTRRVLEFDLNELPNCVMVGNEEQS